MMEHGAKQCRECCCCKCSSYQYNAQPIKTDAEKATEFMEAYVLARAGAIGDSIDIDVVLQRAKEAYLTIHKKNLDEIRREMGR